MSKTETAVKATYFSIIGNTLLALIKGITGYFGNSYAMIADAIESTADIFASFLVLFGIKYSNRPADENHPYGHGRAEPLITFLVVGFLNYFGYSYCLRKYSKHSNATRITKTFYTFCFRSHHSLERNFVSNCHEKKH